MKISLLKEFLKSYFDESLENRKVIFSILSVLTIFISVILIFLEEKLKLIPINAVLFFVFPSMFILFMLGVVLFVMEPLFRMISSYIEFKNDITNKDLGSKEIEQPDKLNDKQFLPSFRPNKYEQRLIKLEKKVKFLEKISPVSLTIVITISVTLTVIFGGIILTFLLEYFRKKAI